MIARSDIGLDAARFPAGVPEISSGVILPASIVEPLISI